MEGTTSNCGRFSLGILTFWDRLKAGAMVSQSDEVYYFSFRAFVRHSLGSCRGFWQRHPWGIMGHHEAI